MAEDDDDETFGDFASASFHSNNSQSNGPQSFVEFASASFQSNGPKSFGDFASSTSFQSKSQSNGPKSFSDDDWGDFVKSQSNTSDASIPSFKSPSWSKPSGALPLSIFGDDEEVTSGVVVGDLNKSSGNGVAGDSDSALVRNNVSNNRNVSIADLYSQYSQTKPGNGYGSNSTGGVDSVENGVYSVEDRNAGRSGGAGLNDVDWIGAGGVSDRGRIESKSDNDEFSFKAYVLDPSENGDLFGGWSREFSSVLDATTSVRTSRSNLETNNQRRLDSSAAGVEDDDGDDGWEFKDAYSEFRAEEVNNKFDSMGHDASERSAYSSGIGAGSNEPLDLFGTSNGSIDFFATSTESIDHFATSSGVSSTSQELDVIGIQPGRATVNGFASETNSIIKQNNIKGLVNHSEDVGIAETDEDFGEFSTATAVPKPGEVYACGVLSPSKDPVSIPNGKIQVDSMGHEASERSAYSSGAGAGTGSNKPLDLFATSNGSIDFSAVPTESVDHFAASSIISSTSQELDIIGIQPSGATVNGFASETNSVIGQNNIKGLVNHSEDVGMAENDENFGEFAAASAEIGPKAGEKDTVNYNKSAIPFSIFGKEESKSWGYSDVQDVFMHQSAFERRNNQTYTTVVPISDLISSLYSQSEQMSSINTIQDSSKTQLSVSSEVSSSNIVNDDHLLDDSSCDGKDTTKTRVDGEPSLSATGDTQNSISLKLKLNNHLDFYSKLKDELLVVAKCHVEKLKEVQGNTVLCGEEATAASLDSDLKLVLEELEQLHFLLEESNPLDHHSGDSCLNQFVEVLLEPQFQTLESEYHFSQNLLRAEKDLRSAMELIRHTAAMLKVLRIGTMEEQRAYISVWSQIICACAKELKHGASIWNQAVEKHVQSQMLNEPQGRKFFLALGEIYRVVVVLGASAKLFKPWTLSSSVDSPGIYTLLEECHAVWSASGLEEALSSVSISTALDNTSLLKSIKHIVGLDAVTLQNYVFKEKENRCWMSILTTGVTPGMKMITWGNERCFVTLANLWANLISRNPPELPQLNLV